MTSTLTGSTRSVLAPLWPICAHPADALDDDAGAEDADAALALLGTADVGCTVVLVDDGVEAAELCCITDEDHAELAEETVIEAAEETWVDPLEEPPPDGGAGATVSRHAEALTSTTDTNSRCLQV